jgi:hypothetical protein
MSFLRFAFLLAVMSAGSGVILGDGSARAEWKSEPPEIMAGGEIIGQYYHLFSKTDPPHMVWVSYQDVTYLCRGADDMYSCQSTQKPNAPPPVEGEGAPPPVAP